MASILSGRFTNAYLLVFMCTCLVLFTLTDKASVNADCGCVRCNKMVTLTPDWYRCCLYCVVNGKRSGYKMESNNEIAVQQANNQKYQSQSDIEYNSNDSDENFDDILARYKTLEAIIMNKNIN
jgi:hypothetical protein